LTNFTRHITASSFSFSNDKFECAEWFNRLKPVGVNFACPTTLQTITGESPFESMCRTFLVASVLWLSWLFMMLVHEAGHFVGALATGGRVTEVVWHPLVMSRTDVDPNPHPLIETWAGPVVGCLVPLGVAAFGSYARLRGSYLAWAFAGFCLIANGAYLGTGVFKPVGDAAVLVKLGTPIGPMAIFGVCAVLSGFWVWHRVSGRFGFGRSPAGVSRRQAYAFFATAIVITALGWVCGNRG
jgi:hypothetical protein